MSDPRTPNVTDLSPLAGMSLGELHMNCVKVVDLSPLAGLPLTQIGLLDVPVKNLFPLGSCIELEMDVVPIVPGLEALRSLPILKSINSKSREQFWADAKL